MCAQRDGNGACVRLSRTDRNLPLALPQASCSNPVCEEGNGPASDGSRRAEAGSSTGGGTFSGNRSAKAWSIGTISTAVSLSPVGAAVFPGDAGVGAGAGDCSPKPGGNSDSGWSWAMAGMAAASTAAAPNRSLVRVRITANVGLDLLGGHLVG